MHMHGTHGMRMPERTSLGRPQRAVERFGTAAPGVAARPSSPGVERCRCDWGVDGREHRATCEGRSGRLGRARLPIGNAHKRAAVARRQPIRLPGRGKRVLTWQGWCAREASAAWRLSE
jgi:hypothetical protein